MITLRKIDLSAQLVLLSLAVISILLPGKIFLAMLYVLWGLQLLSALLNTPAFYNTNSGKAISNYWKLSIIDVVLIAAWFYSEKSGYTLPGYLIVFLTGCGFLIGIYYCFIYNEFIGRLSWRRELGAFTRSKR
ncbi:MAG TPA: hypothetical protein VGD17_10530 [Chitinophagaceae bacterium]